MNWIKGLRLLTNLSKPTGEISKCGASQCSSVNKHQNGILDAENITPLSLQQQRGCLAVNSFQQPSLGPKDIDLQDTLIVSRNMLGKFELTSCIQGNTLRLKRPAVTVSRRYGQSAQDDPKLDRDFLVQLWVADKKQKRSRAKRRGKVVNYANNGETVYTNQSSFQPPLGRWFSGTSITEEKSDDHVRPVLKQPPLSQSATGALKPASLEEARVAPLLARSNLLITRDIEWANLVFGFEQENRYAIVDICYPQSPAGLIREQSNLIARQLLRSRRPFVAYITDAMGNELFRVRTLCTIIAIHFVYYCCCSFRAYLILLLGSKALLVDNQLNLCRDRRMWELLLPAESNSPNFLTSPLRNKQFAVVENPGFWNWTFNLKDIDGQMLAQVDRDWRGFGFEIFTDAGQYVIRFGSADASPNIGPAGVVQELEVARPLTLSERAVAVALAVSLDNDYFSRHGGWAIPFVAVDLSDLSLYSTPPSHRSASPTASSSAMVSRYRDLNHRRFG
ncbi:hypothetical protein TEA_008689 [Camellia sinensis var. sinensis]|uniref:Phospholipid scramblase n=1 Tax=Camellia sinensis var. sinensis TaxID=542762 RepID=A0A4S4E208_CAMSN|nr:hypothetical protein TEA_008689 [Camellia sinensis var. sinensis]